MTDLLELIRSLLGTVPVGYEFLEYIVLFFLLLFGLFIIFGILQAFFGLFRRWGVIGYAFSC